jgi:hypothetical protein
VWVRILGKPPGKLAGKSTYISWLHHPNRHNSLPVAFSRSCFFDHAEVIAGTEHFGVTMPPKRGCSFDGINKKKKKRALMLPVVN